MKSGNKSRLVVNGIVSLMEKLRVIQWKKPMINNTKTN